MAEIQQVDNYEDVKKQVAELLSCRNIMRVVYVDEMFDSSSKTNKTALQNYVRENYATENVKSQFEIYDDADADVAVSKFNQWWEKSTEDNRLAVVNKFQIISEVDSEVKTKMELYVGDLLECVSPAEFVSNLESQKYVVGIDNQMLVLMDFDLQEDNNGMYYLRKVEDNKWIQCGLFSQTFNKDNEIDKWQDGGICNRSKNIFPLAKCRVVADDNGSDFAEGLRNVLWMRQISAIKDRYFDIVENSVKELYEFLTNIDPASFDAIIMNKSAKEGCWEFETLHRVGCLKMNDSIGTQMCNANFSEFQADMISLRNIKNIVGNLPQTSENELNKQMERLEHFEDANYINCIHSQIANGDVFDINAKLYMLLCQPCSMEIRAEGCRNSRSEKCYLIPMKECDEESQESKAKCCGTLKYFGSDYKKYSLHYGGADLTAVPILDLVSFNNDGVSRINFDEDIQKDTLTQPNLKIRYGIVKKILFKYFNAYQELQKSDIKKGLSCYNVINKAFANPDCKGRYLKAPEIKGNTIDFKITRVGRLKDPYAQECLQEFMAYLCRPAFPMSFDD